MNTETKKPVQKLLSDGSTNAKTTKNSIKTFILYLTPGQVGNKNMCPMASKGCLSACLYTAGRGAFSNVQKARLKKTEFFIANKVKFILQLSNEIMKQYVKAKKGGYKIAFRLNGTSDIDFIFMLQKYANLDINSLSDYATFYDYTKILTKAIRYKDHKNYTVTFSRSESNHTETDEAIKLGINVAAVFNGGLPQKYKGAIVIDGDQSDLMMLYNKGVILGLKAKGKARKDTSGFVINTELPF
jgi:hypothetical protein